MFDWIRDRKRNFCDIWRPGWAAMTAGEPLLFLSHPIPSHPIIVLTFTNSMVIFREALYSTRWSEMPGNKHLSTIICPLFQEVLYSVRWSGQRRGTDPGRLGPPHDDHDNDYNESHEIMIIIRCGWELIWEELVQLELGQRERNKTDWWKKE